MSNASQMTKDLARLLFTFEMRQSKTTDSIDITLAVCKKLQVPLVRFAGPVGYSTLLSRALTLAKSKDPLLKTLRVRLDGDLERFTDTEAKPQLRDLEARENPGIALVAQLLELLVTFIGEQLTMTLLRDAWPNESFEKSGFGTEEKS